MARWTKGRTIIKKLPKTASVTFTAGGFVQMTSGYVATATVSSLENVGIILESVASTDSDFASATKVAVEVPTSPSCEAEMDVTGTLATTSIGVAFDLSNASTVNKAGTTSKAFLCKSYISTAKGTFTMCGNADYVDA